MAMKLTNLVHVMLCYEMFIVLVDIFCTFGFKFFLSDHIRKHDHDSLNFNY
jgi:hypothetical protein